MTQDRLRKLTDENRELALTLRREVEAANRVKVGNKPTAKKRKLDDSSRASEERGSSMPARGKRGRDLELEKVCSVPFWRDRYVAALFFSCFVGILACLRERK